MEEMRRKDREVTELEAVMEIIRQCDVLRLGLADGDYPYIVPMNFGWEEKGGGCISTCTGQQKAARRSCCGKTGLVSSRWTVATG